MASFRHREVLRFSIHGGGGDVWDISTVCLVPLTSFGKMADSIPVWAFSGPILRDGLDPRTRQALYGELITFAERELRRRRALDATIRIWDPFLDSECLEPWLRAGYRIEEHSTLMCSVPPEESQIMKNYNESFRREVGQGYRRGGRVEMNTPVGNEELYRLYAMTMSRAGEHPRYDFDEVAYVLNWSNDLKDVYLCKCEGRMVGFAIFPKFNQVSIFWLGGMDRISARIRPMNLIFHQVMLNSVREGMQTVDFGGGPTAGLSHFKEGVGAKPTSLYYMNKTYCNSLQLLIALVARNMLERLSERNHNHYLSDVSCLAGQMRLVSFHG